MSCLEIGKMTSFPKLGTRKIAFGSRSRRTVMEKVYCIPRCRMPNDKSKSMILCDRCGGWFHHKCVNLDEEKSPSKWSCEKCRNTLAEVSK